MKTLWSSCKTVRRVKFIFSSIAANLETSTPGAELQCPALDQRDETKTRFPPHAYIKRQLSELRFKCRSNTSEVKRSSLTHWIALLSSHRPPRGCLASYSPHQRDFCTCASMSRDFPSLVITAEPSSISTIVLCHGVGICK